MKSNINLDVSVNIDEVYKIADEIGYPFISGNEAKQVILQVFQDFMESDNFALNIRETILHSDIVKDII